MTEIYMQDTRRCANPCYTYN